MILLRSANKRRESSSRALMSSVYANLASVASRCRNRKNGESLPPRFFSAASRSAYSASKASNCVQSRASFFATGYAAPGVFVSPRSATNFSKIVGSGRSLIERPMCANVTRCAVSRINSAGCDRLNPSCENK